MNTKTASVLTAIVNILTGYLLLALVVWMVFSVTYGIFTIIKRLIR